MGGSQDLKPEEAEGDTDRKQFEARKPNLSPWPLVYANVTEIDAQTNPSAYAQIETACPIVSRPCDSRSSEESVFKPNKTSFRGNEKPCSTPTETELTAKESSCQISRAACKVSKRGYFCLNREAACKATRQPPADSQVCFLFALKQKYLSLSEGKCEQGSDFKLLG